MFKDEKLHNLSKTHNVARFISFSPDSSIRYFVSADDSKIVPYMNRLSDVDSTQAMCTFMRDISGNNKDTSFNIRTFRKSCEQGNPFEYGLTSENEVVRKIRLLMKEGYYCILNETIDMLDGGLSACVYQNGVISISPGITPRHMETDEYPTACMKPDNIIMKLLERLHDFKFSDFNFEETKRYEFSVHPEPVGYRKEKTVVWEMTDISKTDNGDQFDEIQIWPSRLSRHIGDKLYGLLVARSCGLPTPNTMVHLVKNKHIGPIFVFDEDDSSKYNKFITRPCPREQLPGYLDSIVMESDESKLLLEVYDETKENCTICDYKNFGNSTPYIPSTIIQPLEKADYSGAYLTTSDGEILVEGVSGAGIEFMINNKPIEHLPDDVIDKIKELGKKANTSLNCCTRGEWICKYTPTGIESKLVQLHCDSGVNIQGDTTKDGIRYIPIYEDQSTQVKYNHTWSVKEGLHTLSGKILMTKEAERRTEEKYGIEVVGFIGLTTHAADLLRKHKVVSRMVF